MEQFVLQIFEYVPDLIIGFRNTVAMTLLAFGASLVGGFFLGLGSLSRLWLLRFFRGIPLLVLLWMVYFGLPSFWLFPILLSPGIAVFVAFALSYSGYQAEIFRAAFLAVDRGQIEAAIALGMRYTQIIRRIVLPQTVRVVAPPTVNQFTDIIKSTALAGTVAYSELFRTAYLIGTDSLRFLPPFLLVAAIYSAVCLPTIYWANLLDRRLKRGTAY
jgi:His/Glu/Gln/Arg/opine family amino acid ABC transporter permease subunit